MAGKRASEILAGIQKLSKADPLELPQWAFGQEALDKIAPTRQTPATAPAKTDAAPPVRQAQASDGGRFWTLAGAAMLGLCGLGAGIFLFKRNGRGSLSQKRA